MSEMFFDRYGNKKFIGDAIPISKKGYFAVLLKDDKILVTVPPQSDVPEFPGGYKQRSEDMQQCLYRKLYEETGVDFVLGEGMKLFDQVVRYYDIEEKKGTFYIYDQTFVVYDASSYGFDTKAKSWVAPDGSAVYWLKIQDVASGALKLSYMHGKAFEELFG